MKSVRHLIEGLKHHEVDLQIPRLLYTLDNDIYNGWSSLFLHKSSNRSSLILKAQLLPQIFQLELYALAQMQLGRNQLLAAMNLPFLKSIQAWTTHHGLWVPNAKRSLKSFLRLEVNAYHLSTTIPHLKWCWEHNLVQLTMRLWKKQLLHWIRIWLQTTSLQFRHIRGISVT